MLAALVPIRAEHEVINDEPALAAEQLAERHLAIRPVKDVFLFDLHPRQLATFLIQGIAELRELLLLREEFLSRGEPFFLKNDFDAFNSTDGFDYGHIDL